MVCMSWVLQVSIYVRAFFVMLCAVTMIMSADVCGDVDCAAEDASASCECICHTQIALPPEMALSYGNIPAALVAREQVFSSVQLPSDIFRPPAC